MLRVFTIRAAVLMTLAVICELCLSGVVPADPTGDQFHPWGGQPGTRPDLLEISVDSGGAFVEFTLKFAEPVFPADDWDHYEHQLHGRIDLGNLDNGVHANTYKDDFYSELSYLQGFASIDFALVSEGEVPLLDTVFNPLGACPVTFAGDTVVVAVPKSILPASPAGFVVLVHDSYQTTWDVFPNAPGHQARVCGDANRDGTVGVHDTQMLAECLAGPAVSVPPAGCMLHEFAAADLDHDKDVDLRDYASVQLGLGNP